MSRSLRIGEGSMSIYAWWGVESCSCVGFRELGRVGSSAARVARCVWGFEMTGISRRGAKNWWSDRRISRILLGTTTTRVLASVPVLDKGVDVVGGSETGTAPGT